MTTLAARFGLGPTVAVRVASAAFFTGILSAALVGNVNVDAEPGSVAATRSAILPVLPEEYRSVRRAGFDYDPPPIPPSEIWPAQ